MPIFYGENLFSLDSVAAINLFLSDLMSLACQSIKIIRVALGYEVERHQRRLQLWVDMSTYVAKNLRLKSLTLEFCSVKSLRPKYSSGGLSADEVGFRLFLR